MRKAISKKLRFDVFKRDGFVCAYCGATPPSVVLQVDHIHPIANGGGNEIDNLVTSCQPCNIGKGAKNLSSIPESLSEKAKFVAEQEEQIKGYQKIIRERQERLDAESHQIAEVLRCDWSPSKADFISIKNFVTKLGYFEVEESALIASSKFSYNLSRSFKYFCGICINKLKEVQK
jgi:hypothetical protein